LPKFKQLKCRNLYLVPGNHDNCHKMHKSWKKAVPMYEDAGFTILESDTPGPVIETQVNGTDVLVCHFPYAGDSHFDDRYSGLRPTDEGLWLLHGHVHSPHVMTDLHPRQLHVGVDAWDMKPVSEDTIAEIIAGG
jgi:calcineurin-like phosphoesterase family protein